MDRNFLGNLKSHKKSIISFFKLETSKHQETFLLYLKRLKKLQFKKLKKKIRYKNKKIGVKFFFFEIEKIPVYNLF